MPPQGHVLQRQTVFGMYLSEGWPSSCMVSLGSRRTFDLVVDLAPDEARRTIDENDLRRNVDLFVMVVEFAAATTPAQRLEWLEAALDFAHTVGALKKTLWLEEQDEETSAAKPVVVDR